MAAPVVPLLNNKQRPTFEVLNQIFGLLSGKFGSLDGTDFAYPLILVGDFDLNGNALLGVKEIFGIQNLEQFGTDETAASTVVNLLSGGGVMFIPRDTTITLNRGIKIGSNRNRIYIVGSGPSSVLRLASNADDNVISMDGSRRFRISNLLIDGNSDNNASGSGIVCRDCSEFEISNVWIGESPATGAPSRAIEIVGSRDWSVKRCWIANPRDVGILVGDRCRNWTISQVTIDSSDQPSDDFGVITGLSHLKIEGDETKNGLVEAFTSLSCPRDGISILGGEHVRVGPGCYVHDYGIANLWDHAGIISTGASAVGSTAKRGITIVGNFVDGNGNPNTKGIVIAGQTQGAVQGNQVINTAKEPLFRANSGDIQVDFRDNGVMNVANHGKYQFLVGSQKTYLTLGVSNLPIGAIQATWNYTGIPSSIKDQVLGAMYFGKTVVFYSATPVVAGSDFWYSVEI